MLYKIFLVFCSWTLATQLSAQTELKTDEIQSELDDQLDLSLVEESTTLAYSQKELQENFGSGVGLDLGSVMPWELVGLTMLQPLYGRISSLSLGVGDFEYSGNLGQRNFIMRTKTQVSYLGRRYFFMGFGPIYFEPFLGFVHWNGSIKPRGTDELSDVAASSLTSRFDILGLNLGSQLGVMWQWDSGFFVDVNLISLSRSILLKESYTTNTSDAREAVRKQIAGPVSMTGLNLRFGWTQSI